MQPPLALNKLTELDVSAASGIVRHLDRLCVIADDEHALAVYDRSGAPLTRVPLVPGELPEEPRERKARKPDFEALVVLPNGSLLALGSGSTAQRRRAVRVDWSAGKAITTPIACDVFYERLERELPELNIEGAAVYQGQLVLVSRGNGAARDNALIRIDLARALPALERGHSPPIESLRSVQRVHLGELDGVPLSLTDLTVLQERLVFSAAAENTDNTYDDGACTGSVLGVFSGAGQAHHVVELTPRAKIEGLCAASDRADEAVLYLVADADSREVRAPLYQVEFTYL
jgi:hypothetical protein